MKKVDKVNSNCYN